MRKQISMLLATMLSLQTTTTVFAAPAEPPVPAAAPPAATQVVKEQYSVQIVNGVLQFVKDGKIIREEKLLSTDVKLTNSIAGGLAIQVVDASGKPRRFTLGEQLTLQVSGQMDSLQVMKTVAASANVALAADSKIGKVTVDAPVSVAVAGTVDELKVTAKDASVEVAKTAQTKKVTTVARNAVSGVASNKVQVQTSQPQTSSGSSNSSSGGSSNSNNRPSLASSYTIDRIEPSNMQVKFTLNKPTSRRLEKEDVAILCNTGGKDMTITGIETEDNQVYYLTTASYVDNTYFLSIRLSDGSMINKTFVTSLMGPEINSEDITRTSETAAKFVFNSDTEGTLYYLIQPKTVARAAIWQGTEEPTIAQVKEKGTSVQMKREQNEVQIDGLQAGVGYTVYFVAESDSGKTSSLKYADIDGAVYTPPAQSEYKIVDVVARNSTQGVDGVHNWFEVTFDKPIVETLTAENFTVTCPKQKNTRVGEVIKTGDTTYTVKIEKYTILKNNNTFTITAKFSDGSVASHPVYVDFQAPYITGVTVTRTGEKTAKVQFQSNEPGTFYWKVRPKSEVPDDTSVKDPNEIMSDGQKISVKANTTHMIELNDLDQTEQVFCFVGEDERGNYPANFESKKIPEYNPDSSEGDTSKPTESMEIVSVTAEETDHFAYGKTHRITIIFGETPPNTVLSKEHIVIKGPNGTQLSGNQLGDTSLSDRTGTVLTQQKLDPGTYTLEVTMGEKTGSKEFTIS